MTDPLSLRQEQAQAARERIVEAAVAVIEAGQEPTMRSVAKKAGVSERTMYRYFPARDDLFGALTPILAARASAPMAESVEGLEDYAEALFSAFAAAPQLIKALGAAPWATPVFRQTRSQHLRALESILGDAFPDVPRTTRRNAAAALRVALSGSGWIHLCDLGFSLQQSIDHAQWLIRTVIGNLEVARGGTHA